MSAGQLTNDLLPRSGGGLGMTLANPQNITAMQNWPTQPPPYSPQQQQTIGGLGNLFGQFINPASLQGVQQGGIASLLDQAIQAMGLTPTGVR